MNLNIENKPKDVIYKSEMDILIFKTLTHLEKAIYVKENGVSRPCLSSGIDDLISYIDKNDIEIRITMDYLYKIQEDVTKMRDLLKQNWDKLP